MASDLALHRGGATSSRDNRQLPCVVLWTRMRSQFESHRDQWYWPSRATKSSPFAEESGASEALSAVSRALRFVSNSQLDATASGRLGPESQNNVTSGSLLEVGTWHPSGSQWGLSAAARPSPSASQHIPCVPFNQPNPRPPSSPWSNTRLALRCSPSSSLLPTRTSFQIFLRSGQASRGYSFAFPSGATRPNEPA